MGDLPPTLTLSADLWNGLRLQSLLTPRPISGGIAELLDHPVLRDPRLDLAMTEPAPARQIAQLRDLNPVLPTVLPALRTLMSSAEPSLYFDELYKYKRNRNKSMMPRLDDVLSRHNYLDCETILHLTAPETGREAVLIQSEMDVLTDGSDGDRMPVIAGESPTFQPFTSYAWSKRGEKMNPFLPQVREEQRTLRAELENNPGSARKREIRDRLDRLKLYESDMKSRSHLVGAIDPFIALPLSMVRGPGSSHKPDIGDFAVVIYGDTLYPALVGDAGPRFKMGEASLLICEEINPNTTIYSRPVSDLTVTYLVFPNSAEHPFGPPDYIHIRDRCAELLDELGGFNGTLHKWIEETGVAEAVPAEARDPGSTTAQASPFLEASAILTPEQRLRAATPTPAASGGQHGS
jgi:hypothetical protein